MRHRYCVLEEGTGRVLSFAQTKHAAVQRGHMLGEPVIISLDGEVIAKVKDGKVLVPKKPAPPTSAPAEPKRVIRRAVDKPKGGPVGSL